MQYIPPRDTKHRTDCSFADQEEARGRGRIIVVYWTGDHHLKILRSIDKCIRTEEEIGVLSLILISSRRLFESQLYGVSLSQRREANKA